MKTLLLPLLLLAACADQNEPRPISAPAPAPAEPRFVEERYCLEKGERKVMKCEDDSSPVGGAVLGCLVGGPVGCVVGAWAGSKSGEKKCIEETEDYCRHWGVRSVPNPNFRG